MIFSSSAPKIWSFEKNCTGISLFLYYLERWYFFWKICYFSLDGKMENERWSFSRNTFNMSKCYKYDTSLLKKKTNKKQIKNKKQKKQKQNKDDFLP